MPKWSTNINHLLYGDDTIIFAFADKYSLSKIMLVLKQYEAQLVQMINKRKMLIICIKMQQLLISCSWRTAQTLVEVCSRSSI